MAAAIACGRGALILFLMNNPAVETPRPLDSYVDGTVIHDEDLEVIIVR